MKTHMHVNMCPNITAVTNASLSPSNSGYALKAAKDSGNGVFSFLGALAAGCVADKVGRTQELSAGGRKATRGEGQRRSRKAAANWAGEGVGAPMLHA